MQESAKKFNAFKSADLTDWERAAREELAGANPWEKLAHRGPGWSILPYYDQNDQSALPLLEDSQNNFLGARAWYNCPRLVVLDARAANEMALECLQQGADGLLFELSDVIDFEILLDGLRWEHCSLNFLAKRNEVSLAQSLQDFITGKRIKSALPGAFFSTEAVPGWPPGNFPVAGLHIPPALSPAEEIANALKETGHRASGVAFCLTMGTDFFLDIARLRAYRMVWSKFAGHLKMPPRPLFLHACSPVWENPKYQPHENMIRGTTAALAAILGGCDALTLDTIPGGQPLASRVARNVSNILREESHLSRVADPVAGSYLIENLSNQLSEKAWESVQVAISK